MPEQVRSDEDDDGMPDLCSEADSDGEVRGTQSSIAAPALLLVGREMGTITYMPPSSRLVPRGRRGRPSLLGVANSFRFFHPVPVAFFFLSIHHSCSLAANH